MSDNYSNLPENVRPISPWNYFWLSVLYAVPIVGFIFLLINSLSRSKNVNVRNYSRSYFCLLVICLVIVGIFLAITLAGNGIEKLKQLFS